MEGGGLSRAGVLLLQIVADDVAGQIRYLRSSILHHRPSQIFADGDEFHLGRDDAGAGIGELRDDFAGLGAKRTAAGRVLQRWR